MVVSVLNRLRPKAMRNTRVTPAAFLASVPRLPMSPARDSTAEVLVGNKPRAKAEGYPKL